LVLIELAGIDVLAWAFHVGIICFGGQGLGGDGKGVLKMQL